MRIKTLSINRRVGSLDREIDIEILFFSLSLTKNASKSIPAANLLEYQKKYSLKCNVTNTK